MKKSLILAGIFAGISGFAQEAVNHTELQQIETEQNAQYEAAKLIESEKYAANPMDEGVALQMIDDNGTPIYFDVDSRPQARSMNVDFIEDGTTIPGVAVTGDGYTAYIWDGGKARTTHVEFQGRVINEEDSGSGSSHATGVAGVVAAAGLDTNARGLATSVDLKVHNFTNGSTTGEMANQSNKPENQDYMISNHSYGSLVGWYFNSGNETWYWYGYPHLSETESVLFGHYSSSDRTYDRVAYNAPQHSIFKSSGNNRGEGPEGPVDHFAFNDVGSWVFYENVERPRDCYETGGYDCISFGGSVAKNLILVGAVKPIPVPNRYSGPEVVQATSFTSFGPTDDGRIKPDVVAIGQSVRTTSHSGDSAYGSSNGTSFSSPAVAGVGVLLQQVKNEFDGGFLRSDMMKALLCHTANEAGDHIGPDYKFGYGLVDALAAAETIMNVNGDSYSTIVKLNDGDSYNMTIVSDGTQPLKATISWLDPAAPSSPLGLNNRTPKLINDLDLRITKDGITYYPWKLDPDNPAAAATQGDNIVDNLEQILIENPEAGTYTLTVSHKGELETGVSPAPDTIYQHFALVVTGIDSYMGTKDLDLTDAISIYPNPVINDLNIKLNQNLKNAQVRIFDAMGQIVYNGKTKNLSHTEIINMNSIPAGLYMLYIKSDEGVITKKIIKR